MSKHFYIATMPRSGSAWLANLITTGASFAHHEILRQTYSRGPIEPRWIGGYEFEGAVGCDLSLWTNAMIDGPIVLVRRDPEEAYRSSVRVAGNVAQGQCRALVTECSATMHNLSSIAELVVDFNDLFRVDTIIDIGRALGLPAWDAMRVKQLLGVNVQAAVNSRFYVGSKQFREVLGNRLRLTPA
jgi:hypothetical protein